MTTSCKLGIRWTIGNVSPLGFEALRLSVWGAWKLFGNTAEYVICVNSVSLAQAEQRTGPLPEAVQWRSVCHELHPLLKEHLDGHFAEGVGWKFAPLQIFPNQYELALDNDCILWEKPPGLEAWLQQDRHCLTAEDVRACFGIFQALCGNAPRNSGIRGLPPGFEFEQVLRRILHEYPVALSSELDEQGLQVAALKQTGSPFLVTVQEVSICSPFPPHLQSLGTCGAHFVGLNARQLPWDFYGRPAVEHIHEHWQRHRGELYRKVGLEVPHVATQQPTAAVESRI